MNILSPQQKVILSALADEPLVTGAFYLTGGTALAEFYLQHRLSKDLDFFSENEVDVGAITATLKKIQPKAGITGFRYEQSFNRNLFFLDVGGEIVKTEFTYFPFSPIETGTTFQKLRVDSLLDIAVNKLFTIHQKPRSRDFIDLFFILRAKKDWTLDALTEKARVKFDYHIDHLQLSSQFVKVSELKDFPTMKTLLDPKEWQDFFMKEAARLSARELT